MVNNTYSNKNVFWQVDQIDIEDMHLKSQGYFLLEGIWNVRVDLPEPLIVTDLQNLANGSVLEVDNLHDRVNSDIIFKETEG